MGLNLVCALVLGWVGLDSDLPAEMQAALLSELRMQGMELISVRAREGCGRGPSCWVRTAGGERSAPTAVLQARHYLGLTRVRLVLRGYHLGTAQLVLDRELDLPLGGGSWDPQFALLAQDVGLHMAETAPRRAGPGPAIVAGLSGAAAIGAVVFAVQHQIALSRLRSGELSSTQIPQEVAHTRSTGLVANGLMIGAATAAVGALIWWLAERAPAGLDADE